VPVLDGTRQRVSYVRAFNAGTSVIEHGDQKAAEEIRTLTRDLVAEEGAGEFEVTYIRDSRHQEGGVDELLLSTYLPTAIYRRLRRRSEKMDRSIGELTTEALNQYLRE
jgi:hypothetical protein